MNKSDFKIGGRFKIQHVRDGKVIDEINAKNGVTDEGLDAILDIMFHNDTQIATWYAGLVDNGGFSAFADGDTMASHAGWTEISSGFSEATREEWVEDAASGQSITNTTVIEYNFTSSKAVHGIFVCSNNTLGGTTGTLWATAAFDSVINVISSDVLRITYTVDAATS